MYHQAQVTEFFAHGYVKIAFQALFKIQIIAPFFFISYAYFNLRP